MWYRRLSVIHEEDEAGQQVQIFVSYLARRTSKLNYTNRNQVYVKTNSLLILSAIFVIVVGITLSVAMDMSGSVNESMQLGNNSQVIGEVDDETLLDFDDPIEELLSNI